MWVIVRQTFLVRTFSNKEQKQKKAVERGLARQHVEKTTWRIWKFGHRVPIYVRQRF